MAIENRTRILNRQGAMLNEVVAPFACPLDLGLLPHDFLAQVDSLPVSSEEKIQMLSDLGYRLRAPEEIGY